MKKLKNKEGQHLTNIIKSESGSSAFKTKKKKNNKRQDAKAFMAASAVKEEIPELSAVIPKTEETVMRSENKDINVLDTLWLNYKPRSTTLIKTSVKWQEQMLNEEPQNVKIDPSTIKNLRQVASKILEQDTENYKKVEAKSSRKDDAKFRQTVYKVGTSRDKLAAHVLRCMEAPVHSLHHLNAILLMISPKAKNEFEEAIDSILKLFQSTLLPENRVARKFENHQFSCLLSFLPSNREQAEKQLALWYFEDQVNYVYRKLILQLTQISSDAAEKNKILGIKNLVNLLKRHPTQDTEMILEVVINKLGDPSRKVAAQTMYWLQRLLEELPALKASVVTIVEILLYRPNVNVKAQYYCLCYLKDMVFKRTDHQLATKLIGLYIGFFKACTKKGEVDTRMMGALLRGINRAYPYSRLQGEALHKQLETLYKLCHIVQFSVATQALQLIYQVITSKDHVADRFYQALYGQILDPSFGTSSGNTAFLNLVFKAMMRDDSIERRQAFFKRLLQVGQYLSPHMMCGILFLMSEVLKEKPDMRAAMENVLKSSIDCNDPGDDFETFDDVEDVDEKDVEACKDELKKECEPSYQVTVDIDEDEDIDSKDLKPLNLPAPSTSSWFHSANTNSTTTIRRRHYDPFLRNPMYCGAHYSPLWELLFLQNHFHPSVGRFSEKIAAGGLIDYSGDPMQDFTLIRFLDRFVYKNPKKDLPQSESSAVFGSRSYYTPDGARGLAVNSDAFINLEGEKIPEDQQFFHSYFTKYRVKKKKVDDDDNSSIGDDEFEDYLSSLGGAKDTEPDIEESIDFAAGTSAPSKTDADDGMADSDDDMMGSDDEEPVFGGHSDDSGDEAEFSGKEDDDDDEMDFDEENAAFSDDDEMDSMAPSKTKKFKKQKSSKPVGLENMFASADDFAQLLEENIDEDTGRPSTSSTSIENKDRSHTKQLNWETDRNLEMRGRGRHNFRGQQKKRGGHNKTFGGAGKRGGGNFKGSSRGGHKNNFRGGARGKFSSKSKRGRR